MELDVSMSTHVVLELMGPTFQQCCNASCNDFFTSLDLELLNVEKKCSLVVSVTKQGRMFRKRPKRKRSS